MVDGQQNHGFDKLCLYHGACNGYNGLTRENRGAFGNGPYIALELEVLEIVEERLREASAAAEVLNILLGKVQILEIIYQLLDTGHDGIAAAVRYPAEEHIKVCAPVSHALFEVSVGHSELIKIGQHGQVLITHHSVLPLVYKEASSPGTPNRIEYTAILALSHQNSKRFVVFSPEFRVSFFLPFMHSLYIYTLFKIFIKFFLHSQSYRCIISPSKKTRDSGGDFKWKRNTTKLF